MRVLMGILVLLSPLARGQTAPVTPLTLAQALELAPSSDPDVIAAEADLVAAERALSRQLADPLALEVADLEAESAAESARASLASARLTNRSETSSLFFAVLNADVTKRVAAKTLALARSEGQAAQIRADAGAASGLELLQAENTFAAAQRGAQGADEASLLAYRELADATGLSTTELLLRGLGQLETNVPTVPSLATSLARAQRENSDVAAARRAVQLAQARLEASDTIFSARVDIEAAEDEVTRVEGELGATLRQLTLSVRSAHSDLTGAVRALAEAQATRLAYVQELEAQRTRLQAGAISKSVFGEVEVTDLENVQAVQSARYQTRLATLALEGAVVGSGSASSGALSETTGATSPSSETGASDTEASGTGSAVSDTPDLAGDATGTDEVESNTDVSSSSAEPDSAAPTDMGSDGAPETP